jgi:hypothetical protein
MIIFYINVIELNSGWGAECFVNRGFINNGHKTLTLDYRKHQYKLSKHFLKLTSTIDVLFIQRGDGFPLELLESVSCPRFFWASELVERNRDQDRLLASGLFQHIFVRTPRCKDIIVQNKWASDRHVSVLLSGFDETTHKHNVSVDKDIDILFIGNVLPRRRLWLNCLNEDFNITEVQAFGPEMTGLINRAKIVLNIHAEDFLDTETRVFEVLGCGSFLITEKLSIESPFSADIHLVEVADLNQMKSKIKYYLDHPIEREYIAKHGHAEAMRKHTYTQRAESIANVFCKYTTHSSQTCIDTQKVRNYALKELILRQISRLPFLNVQRLFSQ